MAARRARVRRDIILMHLSPNERETAGGLPSECRTAVYEPGGARRHGPARRRAGRALKRRGLLAAPGRRRPAEEREQLAAMRQLAGGVAHDLNNLLTMIAGYSEVALYQAGPEHSLRGCLQMIREAGSRASLLARQLMASSREQAGQARLLDLNPGVAGVVQLLRPLFGERIEIALSLDPAPAWVCLDPCQLEQVLINLAVNARDAMPSGGRLTIETRRGATPPAADADRASSPGQWVMLAVSDTGCGMDAATLARIFEPFFTTKAPGGGTGIGLANVQRIVQHAGGCIRVRSQPGEAGAAMTGTRFEIYLPAGEC